MSANLIDTLVATFPVATLTEEVTAQYPGKDAYPTDHKVLAGIVAHTFRTKEQATGILWDLYQGRGTSDNIQDILDIAYPGCTKRTASHHLCRFRNAAKYDPKYTPRYPVTGGRGGRITAANIGNLDSKLEKAMRGFFS